jgi:hypothetical protein
VVRKLIAGTALASALTLGFSLPALADPTCYTGCGPSPSTILGGGPSTSPGGPATILGGGPSTPPIAVAPAPVPHESAPPPGGLPFTGTDIEQSVAVASVLLVAGVALVRINRRKARTTP